MQAEAPTLETTTDASGDKPAFPGRVLIADDEHLVAVSLAQHIEDMGIEVIGPACDGARAIELARSRKPDIALMDIRMPNTDGLEVARALFADFRIPSVIVSAYSNPEYVQRGADVGVFGYLLKPVTADELRATLTVAWSRYMQHKRLRIEVTDLKTALENRKYIERAKGMLMDRLGLKEAEAMRKLQRFARDNRRLLHDVARSMVENDRLFDRAGR